MDGRDDTTEIERKFLVRQGWLPEGNFDELVQGYIPTENRMGVRVRRAGDQAWLTLKTPRRGLTRREIEFAIPVAKAEIILREMCMEPLIEKRRYRIEFEGHIWEVDVFGGANRGLVLAEVELDSEDEEVVLPHFVTDEVSADSRYTNSRLARVPYSTWAK